MFIMFIGVQYLILAEFLKLSDKKTFYAERDSCVKFHTNL